jgi:hypothetical protein
MEREKSFKEKAFWYAGAAVLILVAAGVGFEFIKEYARISVA